MHRLPYLAPPGQEVEIVHVDAALVVANKPSGLLSVPGRGPGKDDCLASRVQAIYPEALIVHRLDMETSGLIVLARDREMHRRLSLAFQNRQVEKRYVAVAAGEFAAHSGEIDLPLIADWPNRPRQKVDHAIGKPSLTRFQVLAYDAASDSTRVALAPVSGRSHQLRVHLQALGHPILGDPLYAGAAAQAGASRLLLHAEFLAFAQPATGERLALFCPPPF